VSECAWMIVPELGTAWGTEEGEQGLQLAGLGGDPSQEGTLKPTVEGGDSCL
jgi:hypothetical protein